MILLIDNYDSFVHNLARYVRRLGVTTQVVRNDEVDTALVRELNPQAIILSPGPCAPQQAGCCLDIVRQFHETIPMLGVCLGHQVIAEAFGGSIVRANDPVHGRASQLIHDASGVFQQLPNNFLVGRYHSLIVSRETLPDCLRVNAWLADGTIMAIEHKTSNVVGWQFHPESVLTQRGQQLVEQFLTKAKIDFNSSAMNSEQPSLTIPDQPDWFQRAIEFPGG